MVFLQMTQTPIDVDGRLVLFVQALVYIFVSIIYLFSRRKCSAIEEANLIANQNLQFSNETLDGGLQNSISKIDNISKKLSEFSETFSRIEENLADNGKVFKDIESNLKNNNEKMDT